MKTVEPKKSLLKKLSTLSLVALLLGGAAHFYSTGTAQPAGEGLKFKSWEQSHFEPTADWPFIIAFGLLIVCVIVIAVISRNNRKLRGALRAEKLFMPLNYRLRASPEVDQKGFLRMLGKKNAELYCTAYIAPGTPMDVVVGDLPDFPTANMIVKASVDRCKQISEHHYSVWLQFEDNKLEQSQAITTYLHGLLAQSRRYAAP